ncbi:MAG: hypothetical protein NZ937_09220 [Armatimonadetes bacterium]|nr:hypothetical protein [Armatimonadota bacterium]
MPLGAEFVKLISNKGRYRKVVVKPDFAQQLVDAMWLCWANLTAWQITGDEKFHKMAKASVEWFFGRNIVNAQLYEPKAGACHDGLEPYGSNKNW